MQLFSIFRYLEQCSKSKNLIFKENANLNRFPDFNFREEKLFNEYFIQLFTILGIIHFYQFPNRIIKYDLYYPCRAWNFVH